MSEGGERAQPKRRSRSILGPVGRKIAGGLRGRPVGQPVDPNAPLPAIQPLGRGCVPLASLMFVGLILLIILGSCDFGDAEGLPEAPGKYPIKEKSVTFDGERYSFLWADASGNLKRATTDDVKLQLAEINELEITAERDAILHLRQDEPVTVEARDQQGDFGSFWYPFIVGNVVGGGGAPAPEYRQPTYRFPPTDRIDRGDTITGSTTNTTSRPPAYAPVGGAVSGQSGGAGGGSAAINRSQSSSAVGGQTGGTGAGSAALNKSGSFRSGDQGYTSKVDSGALNPISGRTEPRVGAGSGARTGSSSTSVGGSKPSISTGKGSAPSPRTSSSSGSSSRPSISTTRRR